MDFDLIFNTADDSSFDMTSHVVSAPSAATTMGDVLPHTVVAVTHSPRMGCETRFPKVDEILDRLAVNTRVAGDQT